MLLVFHKFDSMMLPLLLLLMGATWVKGQEEFALVASSPFRLIVSPLSAKLSQESLQVLQNAAVNLIHDSPSDVYVAERTRAVFQTIEYDLNSTNIRFFALTQALTSGVETTDQEQLIREAQGRQDSWNLYVHSKLSRASWLESISNDTQLAEATSFTVVPLFRLPAQLSDEASRSSNLSLIDMILIVVSVALFFAMLLFLFLYRRDRIANADDEGIPHAKDAEEGQIPKHVRPCIERITVEETQTTDLNLQSLEEEEVGDNSVSDSSPETTGVDPSQSGCSVQATMRSMAELMKSVLQAEESEDPPDKIRHFFTDESQQSVGPFEDQTSADSSILVHFDGTVFRESNCSNGVQTIDSCSTSDVFDVGLDTTSSASNSRTSTVVSQWMKNIRVVAKANQTSVASGTTMSSSLDQTSLSSFVTSTEESGHAMVSSGDSSSYFPKPFIPNQTKQQDEEDNE